jgi:phosphoglycerate dehydrogenase-like enzyme
MPKVLVLSPLPATVVRSFFSSYISKGLDVEIVTVDDPASPLLKKELQEADVVIGDYTFRVEIDAEMVKLMKKVKLIQQPSTGYDHIDIKTCAERGIPVANIGGANSLSVAEHTIALALALIKKIPYAHQQILSGKWAQAELMNSVGEIYGKTWGVIGIGRTGREVIKRASALGARIIYHDKVRQEGLEYRELNELINQSDIVSIHLPLTEETRQIIGERELRLMKPDSILINVSRGEICDEKALAKAVSEGWIAGAGVDVFSQEPLPPEHPLLQAAKEGANLILTPHIAGATNEARMRIIQFTVQNVAKVLMGEKPENVVNL